jgi:hypothetical protein
MPLAALPKCFLQDLCVSRRMTVDEWIDLASSCLTFSRGTHRFQQSFWTSSTSRLLFVT